MFDDIIAHVQGGQISGPFEAALHSCPAPSVHPAPIHYPPLETAVEVASKPYRLCRPNLILKKTKNFDCGPVSIPFIKIHLTPCVTMWCLSPSVDPTTQSPGHSINSSL